MRLLPEALQTEVLHFAEFLAEKKKTVETVEPNKKYRTAGDMKGAFGELSNDFDAPLEDFKGDMSEGNIETAIGSK